jgi:hypothetical protein
MVISARLVEGSGRTAWFMSFAHFEEVEVEAR